MQHQNTHFISSPRQITFHCIAASAIGKNIVLKVYYSVYIQAMIYLKNENIESFCSACVQLMHAVVPGIQDKIQGQGIIDILMTKSFKNIRTSSKH